MTEIEPLSESGGSGGRRCALVAILGATNAGKSTLVNRMTGAKVSIVTPKAQTTRFRVRGLAIAGQSQLVLVDTPGIFSPRRSLDRVMVQAAWAALQDADAIVVVYDAQRAKPDPHTLEILTTLEGAKQKALVVLNKVDLVAKPALMPLAQRFTESPAVAEVFMVSAETGSGVQDLTKALAAAAPVGPWLFPEDEASDLPARMLAAEITREKLFLNLHEEIPYGLMVETETWEDFANGDVKITQLVSVAREGHRGIAIGSQGRTIAAVRRQAQRDLEEILGRKVHLFITVRVDARWSEDPARLRLLGLDLPG
ncbi:MAG: GTPase Era [Rhodospirillales bacterium]